MGKNLEHHSSNVSIESNHPGCMWGVLHVLKYHHWRYIKNKLHDKSVGHRKHAKGDGNPGYNITASKDGRTPQNKNAGNHHSTVVNDKKTQPTSVTKASVRSRIKSIISDELSKRKGRHSRSSTYPIRSPLVRTDSFRRTELSEKDLFSDISLSNGCPPIANDKSSPTTSLQEDPFLPKSVDQDYNCEDCDPKLTSHHLGNNHVDATEKELIENRSPQENSKQKSIHVKDLSMDASAQQSKEILDALDMINIDEDFFLKLLQDSTTPSAYHHFHQQHALTRKMGYSFSFPSPGSSCGIGSGARKDKEKQEDRDKLQAGSQTQRSVEPRHREYIRSKSMPSIACPNPSLASSYHLKSHHAQNQKVVRHFKNLKHKIRHAIKESKKEKHRITMDAILHKIPRGHRFSRNLERFGVVNMKEHSMSTRDGKDSPRNGYDSDHSLPSTSNSEQHCISRTVSFIDSLDRYCQLYDSSFNREAKQHCSEKLKMKAEGVVSPQMSASRSMGRIFSLPDLRSYPCSSGYSSDSFSLSQVRTMIDGNVSIRGHFSEQDSPFHPIASERLLRLHTKNHVKGVNMESESDSVIGDQLDMTLVEPEICNLIRDDSSNSMTVNWESTDKQDTGSQAETLSEVIEPNTLPVPDSKLQDETTRPANIFVSEDADQPTAVHLLPDRLEDYLENHLIECSMDTPRTRTVTKDGVDEKIEFSSSNLKNEMDQPFRVEVKEKAEFDYVRDILALSGFTGNELLGTWNFDDQPVNYSVFEEAEGCMLLDPECCGSEEGGNCHHLLLFDLINEVLMEIYAKSYTFYPMPLSSLSHVRPTPPLGYHVLEEVWANIRWYLNSTTEDDHLLDYALSRDLAKSDGWMNLQYDTEFVGLELEDLIFEDLLEETICT